MVVRGGGTPAELARRLGERNLLPINSQRDLLIVTPASVVIILNCNVQFKCSECLLLYVVKKRI